MAHTDYVVAPRQASKSSAGGWRTALWGELATLEYGKSLRGYRSSTGPYKVYGTNGPIGRHCESLCPYASVIIGRKGAYRGVHYSPDPFFVIDTAFYLKPKVELDTRWAYYQLLTQDINSMDSGSAIPSTSREDFYGLPVQLPPLSDQRAIAHILGTLDDKIELNRRMNQTLEEMARALFKSWFVDFDPVRAKATLKQHSLLHASVAPLEPGPDRAPPTDEWTFERARAYLAAMDPQIVDAFPDRLVNSELGEIPEGWEVLPAGEAVAVYGGGTPSTKESSYWGDTHCFATPKDMSALQEPILTSTARRLTDAGLARISSGLLEAGSVLLSSRAPIGYLAVTDTPTAINQGIIAMVCHGPVGATYALNWTRANLHVIEDRASGTTFPEISKTSFRAIPFLVPSEATHNLWDSVIAPIYNCIASNQKQSQGLRDQLDTLLPKLISGEILVHQTG